MRVLLQPPLRVGDADPVEQLGGLLRRRRALMPRCRVSTSVTCNPIGITGFSEESGSWKIIAMSRPRMSRAGPVVELEQVRAVEDGLAADPQAGLLGQQAHDRQRGDALAAAGLADQADHLAGVDREGHPVDGVHGALTAPGEGDGEIVDLEQCH